MKERGQWEKGLELNMIEIYEDMKLSKNKYIL